MSRDARYSRRAVTVPMRAVRWPATSRAVRRRRARAWTLGFLLVATLGATLGGIAWLWPQIRSAP